MTRFCSKSGGLAAGLFALFFLLAASGVARASSFSVSPIRVTISRDQPTATVHLQNKSSTPTVVQLSLKAWTQKDGKDVYSDTRDLVATPPIFTIPAGQEQVVRIGLRHKSDSQTERAYRLFLTEIPPPPKPGFRGLRFALKVGVPVFVPPPGVAQAKLEWSADRPKPGRVALHVMNAGNAHAHITHVALSAPGASKPFYSANGGYALAGKELTWTVENTSKAISGISDIDITAQTDNGPVHAHLTIKK